jgi:hypothetical protein
VQWLTHALYKFDINGRTCGKADNIFLPGICGEGPEAKVLLIKKKYLQKWENKQSPRNTHKGNL